MNTAEKPLLARVQDCLNTMSVADPTKPPITMRVASNHLYHAIGQIGRDNLRAAAERLNRAEAVLGIQEAEKPTVSSVSRRSQPMTVKSLCNASECREPGCWILESSNLPEGCVYQKK